MVVYTLPQTSFSFRSLQWTSMCLNTFLPSATVMIVNLPTRLACSRTAMPSCHLTRTAWYSFMLPLGVVGGSSPLGAVDPLPLGVVGLSSLGAVRALPLGIVGLSSLGVVGSLPLGDVDHLPLLSPCAAAAGGGAAPPRRIRPTAALLLFFLLCASARGAVDVDTRDAVAVTATATTAAAAAAARRGRDLRRPTTMDAERRNGESRAPWGLRPFRQKHSRGTPGSRSQPLGALSPSSARRGSLAAESAVFWWPRPDF